MVNNGVDVAFVIPAWRRYPISRVAFAGIAWTIRELRAHGVDALAIVIADDENLDPARHHGFHTIEQDNERLGRKFNDGIEHAAKIGARYVMPVGSDNWIHPDLVRAHLDSRDSSVRQVSASRKLAIVREDGRRLTEIHVSYDGGCGLRMYATAALRKLDHRPARDERASGIDGSILSRVKAVNGGRLHFTYTDLDPLQIVDFKSDVQLNTHNTLDARYGVSRARAPWKRLRDLWPNDLVDLAESAYTGAT